MSTQDDVLLEFLKKGNIVTTRLAPDVLGIADVRANIRNLRNKGIPVKDRWVENINRYGNTVRYKEYFLEKLC